MLSVLAWYSTPWSALYCAANAASLSLTNSTRLELHGQGTQVMAVHVGLMDTDMTAGIDAPKSSPDDVARQILDGVQSGALEVLADDSRQENSDSRSEARRTPQETSVAIGTDEV